MSDLDLDRLAELADAATPGPWELGDGWVYTDPIYEDDSRLANVAVMSKFADAQRQAEEHTRIEANLAFIAACSPSVVSALVQRTRDAEARADKAEAGEAHEGDLKDYWCERANKAEAERDAAIARAETAEKCLSVIRANYDKTEANLARAEKDFERAHDDRMKADKSFRLIAADLRNSRAALSGLVDRITQLADRWQARADDMKEPAREILLNHAAALRALTATSSPTGDDDG